MAFLRRLTRRRANLFAFAVLLAVVLMALLAPILVPESVDSHNLTARLKPPGWTDTSGRTYLAGTDHLGRDLLGRLVYGSQVSLLVSLAAVGAGGGIGLALGLISGFYGGKVDTLIMRLVDVQLAFPFLLLAMALVALLGSGLSKVILVLALTSWIQYAKVVRGAVLVVRNQDYVQATRALGSGGGRILFRHVLPNVFSSFLVIASFQSAAMIIAESSLSYLGLGVPPTTPTWGGMLADGREYVTDAWWICVFPGVALMVTALSFNILGDGLRDALDPTLKNNT